METLIPHFPLLKEFAVLLGSSYEEAKIQWGPYIESLHIETSGSEHILNVPENLVKFYVGKSLHYKGHNSRFVSLSNFSALLSEKILSLELFEFAVKKEHLKLLNLLKVQVNKKIKTLCLPLDFGTSYL